MALPKFDFRDDVETRLRRKIRKLKKRIRKLEKRSLTSPPIRR